MTTLTLDRDYWRYENNFRLIEEARESGHELAIALGERLASTSGDHWSINNLEAELSSRERDIVDLQHFNEELRDENAALHREADTAEAILRRFVVLAAKNNEHAGHIFGGITSEAQAWLESYEQGGRDNG